MKFMLADKSGDDELIEFSEPTNSAPKPQLEKMDLIEDSDDSLEKEKEDLKID